MLYEYANKIGGDFIAEILRIDEIVFDPRIQGSDNSIRSRYNANRESVVLACDNNKVIGYITFFPITNSLSKRIERENRSFDDDIKSDDILPSYCGDDDFDVFLISSAILPDYQKRGIGTALLRKCMRFILDKKQSGCRIRNMFAYAYSDGGIRLLSNAGFVEAKVVDDVQLKSAVRLMAKTLIETSC